MKDIRWRCKWDPHFHSIWSTPSLIHFHSRGWSQFVDLRHSSTLAITFRNTHLLEILEIQFKQSAFWNIFLPSSLCKNTNAGQFMIFGKRHLSGCCSDAPYHPYRYAKPMESWIYSSPFCLSLFLLVDRSSFHVKSSRVVP